MYKIRRKESRRDKKGWRKYDDSIFTSFSNEIRYPQRSAHGKTENDFIENTDWARCYLNCCWNFCIC